eukprot:evm.model.scf_423.4 EVM.evm.TU.scf_423.4   scf_423:47927-48502(+)
MARSPWLLACRSGLRAATRPAPLAGPRIAFQDSSLRPLQRLLSGEAAAVPSLGAEVAGSATGPSPLAGLPLSFGFSAGGLLFPYLVGAAYALNEAGLLTGAMYFLSFFLCVCMSVLGAGGDPRGQDWPRRERGNRPCKGHPVLSKCMRDSFLDCEEMRLSVLCELMRARHKPGRKGEDLRGDLWWEGVCVV